MDVPIKKSEAKYGVVSASKIIGEAVINRQNENLGTFHELVIDAKDRRLTCAVLTDNVVGLGDRAIVALLICTAARGPA